MNICTIFWHLSLNMIAETERMLLVTVEEEKVKDRCRRRSQNYHYLALDV
jgi:hypothetical protein